MNSLRFSAWAQSHRALSPRVLTIAGTVLALHLIALLSIGGLYIQQKRSQPAQFQAAPTPIPLAKKEYPISLERMKQSSRLPRHNPIAVDSPHAIDIPQVVIPNIDSHALAQELSSACFTATFDLKGATLDLELPHPSLFFGQKIQAQKLGVIWDVSRSMHRYLAQIQEEVQQQFPQATLVLTSGSGLHPQLETEIHPLKRSKVSGSKIDKHFASSELALAQDIFKSLQSRKDTYFTEARLDQACATAFQQLIQDQVDAIYWFGDFQDPIDSQQLQTLSLTLQQHQIPVYLHHPQGIIKGPATLARVQEIEKCLLHPTGGNLITQKL